MLSRDCEEHVRTKIKEAAIDYRQDPGLNAACSIEVRALWTHSESDRPCSICSAE